MGTGNVYPTNTKWFGFLKIPLWGKIVLNIVIPLIIGGLLLAILITTPEPDKEGKMIAYGISLLSALFTSVLILLVQKEFEASELAKINTDVISRDHYIKDFLENADQAIAKLIDHLATDCYNTCSEKSNRCKDCERFKQRICSGLLREYLWKTCDTLSKAIELSREGAFKLTTNIEAFHTLATDHLISFGGSHYSVVHWIGDVDLPEEKYNFLDYHFLGDLIEKLAKPQVNHPPYYKNFKIRWLLIGNQTKIMNSYDYIFYTIDYVNLTRKLNLNLTDLDGFFEFYVVSDTDYRRSFQSKQHILSDTGKELYSKREPNIGLFGDYFMFFEEGKENEYGIIGTNQYKKQFFSRRIVFF